MKKKKMINYHESGLCEWIWSGLKVFFFLCDFAI